MDFIEEVLKVNKSNSAGKSDFFQMKTASLMRSIFSIEKHNQRDSG